MYVWNGDGRSYDPVFPKYLNGGIVTAPAIADVDGDLELDIVVAVGDQTTGTSNRKVHVLNLDGSEVSGWPKPANLSKDTGSSPAVGDVDKNGVLDVVVGDVVLANVPLEKQTKFLKNVLDSLSNEGSFIQKMELLPKDWKFESNEEIFSKFSELKMAEYRIFSSSSENPCTS